MSTLAISSRCNTSITWHLKNDEEELQLHKNTINVNRTRSFDNFGKFLRDAHGPT